MPAPTRNRGHRLAAYRQCSPDLEVSVGSSTSVRFSGGPAVPTAPGQMPSPGEPIVEHLLATLPTCGVLVLGHEDIEYAHELRCQVGQRVYEVCVSYDWVQQGWWEVFWAPTLGFFGRLLGRTEEEELRRLALAVSQSLDSLPGIRERRWYPTYAASVRSNAPFTNVPAT